MTDFTHAQAKRWVAQEAAKHPTPESRGQRIASEQAFCVRLVTSGISKSLPRSFQAHLDLIKVLMGDA